jgi:hypothetical protein
MSNLAQESKPGAMKANMRVSTSKEKSMEEANLLGKMALCTRANSRITISKGKVATYGQTSAHIEEVGVRIR